MNIARYKRKYAGFDHVRRERAPTLGGPVAAETVPIPTASPSPGVPGPLALPEPGSPLPEEIAEKLLDRANAIVAQQLTVSAAHSLQRPANTSDYKETYNEWMERVYITAFYRVKDHLGQSRKTPEDRGHFMVLMAAYMLLNDIPQGTIPSILSLKVSKEHLVNGVTAYSYNPRIVGDAHEYIKFMKDEADKKQKEGNFKNRNKRNYEIKKDYSDAISGVYDFIKLNQEQKQQLQIEMRAINGHNQFNGPATQILREDLNRRNQRPPTIRTTGR